MTTYRLNVAKETLLCLLTGAEGVAVKQLTLKQVEDALTAGVVEANADRALGGDVCPHHGSGRSPWFPG